MQFDYLIPLIGMIYYKGIIITCIYFVTDKLQGVCVAGDKLFLLQNDSPQLLNWEEYGLRIAIPQGAVQQSDTVEVAITALVGGEFILPEDTELVSAVYAISVSKPLLKPVQLEIQHCVSIEEPAHSNYLSFATAPIDQPPYQFEPVEGGEFPIGSRYGSLFITKFSLWNVFERLKKFFRRRPSPSPSTKEQAAPVVAINQPLTGESTSPPSPHQSSSAPSTSTVESTIPPLPTNAVSSTATLDGNAAPSSIASGHSNDSVSSSNSIGVPLSPPATTVNTVNSSQESAGGMIIIL